MKAAIDLHIHSALSPCADNEMTPNNIVNMAILKGLDIIAVTDHNSVENCIAVQRCAEGKDILVVPGMEVETREEVHLICLFPDINTAQRLQHTVYEALPNIDNREDIFGFQIVMDENDKILGYMKQLLVTAADMCIDDVFNAAEELGGVVIPAHVDRQSNSIISNLGLIPDNLELAYLEVSRKCCFEELIAKNLQLEKFKLVRSSDAHYLGDILERESFIEIEQLSAPSLIQSLKSNISRSK